MDDSSRSTIISDSCIWIRVCTDSSRIFISLFNGVSKDQRKLAKVSISCIVENVVAVIVGVMVFHEKGRNW